MKQFARMRSIPRLSVLAVWLFSAALHAAIPFPQTGSDLAADPAARFGTLPNGLRYVVRANKEPKDRAALRLLVEAGSLHERDDQQGLAHFLEHMAFNGSKQFPPGSLIEFFQRMGMNFGGDTNASTGFDRTLYLLDLPDTRDATLDEGIKVFVDYAGGLDLGIAEIDRERGIILSEKRTRDSVGYRTFVAGFEFMFDGTKFPRRLPIGTVEVIQSAPRERFVEFYETWYRPELMSIVVVGDIDPARMEQKIIDAFSPLQGRAPAPPPPDLGKLKAFEGVHVFHHHEAEAPATTVTINTVVPYQRKPDTAANRLKDLPRSLAHSIINRRLAVLARKENAPFNSGSAGVGESYGFFRQSSISLNCRAEQWSPALAVADQELRRALEHGFQPAELQEVVADFRNSLEESVKTAATRRSDSLAYEIANSLLDREVYTTPEDDLALFGPALDKVTVQDCVAALRETWSPPHRLVMVTGNARIGGEPAAASAKAAITSAYERSRAVAVAPPETIEDLQWAYTDFGAPGTVARREFVQDLDVHLITFANGVRLNLKPTDFEANRIRINVRIGKGQLVEPRDKPGLTFYTGQTFSEGGLGRHSSDDLRRLTAGRTVGASFNVAGDAFVSSGSTNRADLLLQLQLMTARLVDPGYRPEAARQAAKAIEQMYLSFAHTPGGPFALEVQRLLVSGDTRFGLPSQDEMLKRNLDEVRTWLAPELARGAIEIALVGDLDVDETIAAVARTFGALPSRAPRPALEELRQVKFPVEPFAREFSISTDIPKGTVAVYWPTTDGREVHRARRLSLLGEVLSDRLRVKVREELGDAYSPGAGSAASDLYPDYGYMTASITVDPPRAQQVADIVVEIADQLATAGVTEDELERAKKPILTSLRESSRTNGYWLGSVLSRAQERPEVLDWSRSRYSDFESISKAELDALAKAYLDRSRSSRVVIVPKETPGTATPPVAATH